MNHRPACDSDGETLLAAPQDASTACSSASISRITSASAKTSPGCEAIWAPALCTGADRAAVRFHTTKGVPERARRSAIGWPMTPMPIKPTFMLDEALTTGNDTRVYQTPSNDS